MHKLTFNSKHNGHFNIFFKIIIVEKILKLRSAKNLNVYLYILNVSYFKLSLAHRDHFIQIL